MGFKLRRIKLAVSIKSKKWLKRLTIPYSLFPFPYPKGVNLDALLAHTITLSAIIIGIKSKSVKNQLDGGNSYENIY
jgi:hypothetical protein